MLSTYPDLKEVVLALDGLALRVTATGGGCRCMDAQAASSSSNTSARSSLSEVTGNEVRNHASV